MATCGAKNARGKPCGMPALQRPGPPRCWRHAPDKAKERKKADREGGKQRMRRLKGPPPEPRPAPKTKKEIVAELWRVHQLVSSRAISARDGNLMVLSLRAMLETHVLADEAPAGENLVTLIVRRRCLTSEQAAE